VDITGIELMRISTKQYPAIAYSILCNATELEFNICGCIWKMEDGFAEIEMYQ